jgi:ribonucleoside-diphosphate reductase beta chain
LPARAKDPISHKSNPGPPTGFLNWIKSMSNLTQKSEIYTPTYSTLKDVMDRHERSHWIPDEADLRQDSEQWKNGTIKDEEKAYIKNVLRLFTQSDTDVAAAYVEKLLPIFKNPDARMMLMSFAARESIHVHGYRKLNETLGFDTQAFMEEFLTYSEMKSKHDFMVEETDLSSSSGVATYLAKQVLMEGVNLFGSFAMLLSLSQRGVCPGTISINLWSVADETLHVEGLSELFKIYLQENPTIINNHFKAQIYETARSVVKLEDEFIDLVYSTGSNPSLTAEDTKLYVRYVCDYRMQQLGLKPQFGVKTNPLPWIDLVLSNTFGNFFETTVVQYSKNALSGEWVY